MSNPGRRGTAGGLAIASLLVALMTGTASPAAATERVADGGFEGATCSSVDCTSPVWHEALNSGSGVGFLCATTVPACHPNYTSTSPANGQKWALWLQGDASGGSIDGSVWQTGVAIPAPPATLSFAESPNIAGNAGYLMVEIDGSTVYQEINSGGNNVSYERKSVSLDQFAGPGSHTLTFRVALITLSGTVTPYYPRWNIDDVSLDAANARAGPNTPTCFGKPATILGTKSSEPLTGSAGADVIVAGGGNDVVKAGGGADRVCGGAGNDVLRGEAGSDRLDGENGRDRLNGGAGKGDVCKGGAGKDRAAKSCEAQKSA